MRTVVRDKLDRLRHILRTSRIVDILFVGGLVQDKGIWTVERITGKNPIYLKFDELFIEVYSLENEKGCELQWNICDRINLPPPVYEDDPDEIEFRYVLYSIFNVLALGSPDIKVERGLVLKENSNDDIIIRGIDLELSSGVICRFDPFSFDGLQLNLLVGQLGDKLNIDKDNINIEQISL